MGKKKQLLKCRVCTTGRAVVKKTDDGYIVRCKICHAVSPRAYATAELASDEWNMLMGSGKG